MKATRMMLLVAWLSATSLQAAPLGTAFLYQGRLNDGANPVNDQYDFVFRLFDAPAGTNQLGIQQFFEEDVIDGLFTLPLDFGPNAFNGQARWLEISVRLADTGAYTTLQPRQQIYPAPYALLAGSVTNGAITASKLAPGSVTSPALSRFLTVGAPDLAGLLEIYSDNAPVSMRLDGDGGVFSVYGSDALENFRVGSSFDGGEIQLFDRFTNDMTVRLSSGAGVSFDYGGLLELFSSSDPLFPSRRQVNLNSGFNGGQLELYNRSGNRTFVVDGSVGDMVVGQTVGPFVRLGAGGGLGIGWLGLYGPDGAQRVDVRADAVGEMRLFNQVANPVTLRAGAQPDANSGGSLFLRQPNGAEGVRLYANGPGGLNPGGLMRMFQGNGLDGISLVGNASTIFTLGIDGLLQTQLGGLSYGELVLHNGLSANAVSAQLTTELGLYGVLSLNNFSGQQRAKLSAADAGSLLLHNSAGALSVDVRSQFSAGNTAAWVGLNDNGSQRITFAARNGSTGTGGLIGVFNGSGAATVLVTGDAGGGHSKMGLFNASGVEVIQLHASHTAGKGRIVTPVLEITAGADLSEQFEVSSKGAGVEPGMVVCIDPQNSGKLTLSTKAHDRTVAGIVSGAGGVEPGMLMGQRGSVASGEHPVALTGRVYCWVDASGGAVSPGDLLTTSDTPGHAMQVKDHTKAQGAIIGKAMTGLDHGKGLVLVLVSLQ